MVRMKIGCDFGYINTGICPNSGAAEDEVSSIGIVFGYDNTIFLCLQTVAVS